MIYPFLCKIIPHPPQSTLFPYATLFPSNVSVALSSNPGGATLGGTTPVTAVSGVATFFDLSLNKTGTGYTLTASSTIGTTHVCTPVTVKPRMPSPPSYTQQPNITVASSQ